MKKILLFLILSVIGYTASAQYQISYINAKGFRATDSIIANHRSAHSKYFFPLTRGTVGQYLGLGGAGDTILTWLDRVPVLWDTTGNNLFPADLNWNVGIGTSNPGELLTVNGDARVIGTLTIHENVGMENHAYTFPAILSPTSYQYLGYGQYTSSFGWQTLPFWYDPDSARVMISPIASPLLRRNSDTAIVMSNDTLYWNVITGGSGGSLWDSLGQFMWQKDTTKYVGIGMTNPNNYIQVRNLINFDTVKQSTFLGFHAGSADGLELNTAIGDRALQSVNNGFNNVAIGVNTLDSLTSGYDNVAVGNFSQQGNKTGYQNTSVGLLSLNYSNGINNTSMGSGSMEYSATGNNNTAMGLLALHWNGSGSYNVALGDSAGYNNMSGSGNLFLGSSSGHSWMGSNALFIDNSDTIHPLIYGNFLYDSLTFNGVVRITGGSPGIGKVLTDVDGLGNAVWATPGSTGMTSDSSGFFHALTGHRTIQKFPNDSVGIGLTNPAHRLHVAGTIYNSGAYGYTLNYGGLSDMRAYSNTHALSPYITLKSAEGTISSPSALTTGKRLGLFGYSGYGTDAERGYFRIISEAGDDWTNISCPMNTVISQTAPDGVSEGQYLTLKSNGDFTFNSNVGGGNVGIATTNPTHKLHVVGETYLNGAVLFPALTSRGSDTAIVVSNDTAYYKVITGGSGVPADSLAWVKGSVNTYLRAVRNVGIGLQAPSALLQVSGNGMAGTVFRIGNNKNLSLADSGMFVNSNGNVGIGTSSTTCKLYVNSRQPASYGNDVTATMTSNTDPSPNVILPSQEYSALRAGWKAFDKDGASYWIPTIGSEIAYLTYDFGAGYEKVIVKYTIDCNDNPTVAPKTWTYKGSNNNSSWTTLDTRTNQTSWGSTNAYTFSNSNAYRYYKLDITAGQGGNILCVEELTMHEAGYVDVPFVVTAGNVGVGTTAPAMALDVYGKIGISGKKALDNQGTSNIWVGEGAGASWTTGTTTVAVGKDAGYSVQSGTGNLFLGYQAGYSETGSNKLYIDNSNTTKPLIYGNFSTDSIGINGKLKAGGINAKVVVDSVNAVRLHGNATVWDDLMGPFVTGREGNTGYPPFSLDSLYYTFAAPTDTTSNQRECFDFTIQLPHSWKEGSTVFPHVHYKYLTANGAPTFRVQYKWYALGGTTQKGWKWCTMGTNSGTTDKTHQIVSSATGMDGTGMGISSILICRVYLAPTSTATTVHAWQFDIHYERDAMGSNTEIAK